MRTTLNIDEDVFCAVKEIAREQSRTCGAVVSDLLRAALTGGERGDAAARGREADAGARWDELDGEDDRDELDKELGLYPFPKRGGIVTNELVNRLRDEAGV